MWLIAMDRFPVDPFDSFSAEKELWKNTLFLGSVGGLPFTTKYDQLSRGNIKKADIIIFVWIDARWKEIKKHEIQHYRKHI